MSIERKCDICGKTYVPYFRYVVRPMPEFQLGTYLIPDVNGFIFCNISDNEQYATKGRCINLCQECLDSLIDWMYERSTK